MDSSKNKILARLKAAQDKRGEIEVTIPDFTSSVYPPRSKSLSMEFKTNLEAIGGKVFICKSKDEITNQITQICTEKLQDKIFCTDPNLKLLLSSSIEINSDETAFAEISIGVTGCEYLVAHLGSVLVSSAQISGRRLNVFPETHIVIAHETQLTDYLEQALEKMQNKYKNELPSLISNITGPSRTADIEKTLVMGMHGPKSLIVIISEELI